MIAQELEVSLHMAFVEARQQRHEFITVEHLLLALLDNPSAAEVLRACSANIDDLRKFLKKIDIISQNNILVELIDITYNSNNNNAIYKFFLNNYKKEKELSTYTQLSIYTK